MELGIFQDPLISDAGCRKYPAAYNCVIIKFCKHKVPYRYNVSLQANSARLLGAVSAVFRRLITCGRCLGKFFVATNCLVC